MSPVLGFLRQDLIMQPRLVWNSDPPASASWILRLQVCTTVQYMIFFFKAVLEFELGACEAGALLLEPLLQPKVYI
jgi:hypothetical protein